MRWLKELIKENMIIFLGASFVLGALVICTADYFLWFDVDAQEKIDATILWLTSLAIFWYAYEAYQLKISTVKQTDTKKKLCSMNFYRSWRR